jgi:hypothetical protein
VPILPHTADSQYDKEPGSRGPTEEFAGDSRGMVHASAHCSARRGSASAAGGTWALKLQIGQLPFGARNGITSSTRSGAKLRLQTLGPAYHIASESQEPSSRLSAAEAR